MPTLVQSRLRLLVVAAGVVALVGVGGAACGGDDAPERIGIVQLAPDAIPGRILGLEVDQEDMAGVLATIERPFVKSTGLWSLRTDDELQATLQISRFTDDAPLDDEEFVADVVADIGSTTSSRIRVADETVYLTSGDRQTIAVFIADRNLVIVAARDDFDRPRALLRAVLDLEVRT